MRDSVPPLSPVRERLLVEAATAAVGAVVFVVLCAVVQDGGGWFVGLVLAGYHAVFFGFSNAPRARDWPAPWEAEAGAVLRPLWKDAARVLVTSLVVGLLVIAVPSSYGVGAVVAGTLAGLCIGNLIGAERVRRHEPPGQVYALPSRWRRPEWVYLVLIPDRRHRHRSAPSPSGAPRSDDQLA